jgi:pilus assembly protein CpaF
MALLDRLRAARSGQPASAARIEPDEVAASDERAAAYQELKSEVHNALFDLLDLSKAAKLSQEEVRRDVALATRRVLEDRNLLLNLEEREQLVQEIQDEVFGLGPLEPLLSDPTVSDVLVNGHRQIYVERRGKLIRTSARFKDDAHLMRIIERIVSAVGRRVDESTPMVDARLADGSRINAIIPPLALDGPMLSVRRFPSDPLMMDDLIEIDSITPEIADLLRGIVRARLNVLISGGTGTGKTTLLNVVSGFIPSDERIVTIEDSAELQLKQEHVARLETRPPNLEGKGAIGQRQLVINALRMRPDRIIVGEVRGPETFDMLQAMNTGHDGSLTTVHANSARDALSRLENMVSMGGLDIPVHTIRQQIASALDVVVQLVRLADGRRKLSSLQEITGMEGEVVTMQEIFRLDRHGIDADGTVRADLVATGIRPSFIERLQQAGVEVKPDAFEPRAVA